MEKDQADGYTFIEEAEGPVHMLVLEKLVTAEKQ